MTHENRQLNLAPLRQQWGSPIRFIDVFHDVFQKMLRYLMPEPAFVAIGRGAGFGFGPRVAALADPRSGSSKGGSRSLDGKCPVDGFDRHSAGPIDIFIRVLSSGGRDGS